MFLALAVDRTFPNSLLATLLLDINSIPKCTFKVAMSNIVTPTNTTTGFISGKNSKTMIGFMVIGCYINCFSKLVFINYNNCISSYFCQRFVIKKVKQYLKYIFKESKFQVNLHLVNICYFLKLYVKSTPKGFWKN